MANARHEQHSPSVATFSRRFAILDAYLRAGADDHDIVCFQELLVDAERAQLTEAAAAGGLVYNARAEGGVPLPCASTGSGVHMFSRWPIVEKLIVPFLTSGHTTDLDRLAFHSGKAVLLCRIRTPFGMADVFGTHTNAQWTTCERENADGRPDRMGQLITAAQAIRHCTRSPLVLFMGDFNALPDSLEMRLLQRLTGLADTHSWGLGEGEAAVSAFNTPTCGYWGNTWTPKVVQKTTPTTFEFNCRLDYILAANASTEAAWAVEKSSLCFNDPILVPERFKNLSASDLDRVNVSDHAGLSLTLGLVIACLGFCGACGAVGAAVVAFLLGLGSTAPLVALGIVGCMLLALVLAPAVLFLAMLPLLAEVLLVAEASAALLVLSCLWTWICTMSAPMSATAARAQRDWLASLEPNGEMNSRHLRGARSNARVGQTGAEHHRRT